MDHTDNRPRRNLKLVVAYNGAAYHGWQRQAPGIETIQLHVEQIAGRIVRHPVTVWGAGRTDAGVHAEGQVANFYTTKMSIPLEGMRRAMNAKLPRDIAIISAAEVGENFHASRSAIGKTYRYRIHVSPIRPVMLDQRICHYWRALDVERMREAAARLVGTRDFRGFAASAEIRDNTVRTIFACEVALVGQEIHITVKGDGFLYNMVRIISGTLMEVGRGRWDPSQIDEILASRDRGLAGPTAPARGLYMVCVHYRSEDLVAPRRD